MFLERKAALSGVTFRRDFQEERERRGKGGEERERERGERERVEK